MIHNDDADDASVEQTADLCFGVSRFRKEARVVDGEGDALREFAGKGEVLRNETSP